MKEKILFELNTRLTAMGIVTQVGQGADISIDSDFVEVVLGIERKKIHYEAFICANEQEKIVYMYKKTTGEGQGFSFGGDNGYGFQNRAALDRKVKSIQNGPDGKAYEYNIDLEMIPKTVKDVAKTNGWKFKTVIGKHKVMNYSTVNQSAPESLHYESTGKVESYEFEKRGLFGMVAFIILGMLMIGALVLLESTLICWIVSLAIYGIALFLQRIRKDKNFIIQLGICAMTAVILLVEIALLS